MPRKNKRDEKMRPAELRFWQARADAEEAADAKKTARRDTRKESNRADH